MTVILLLATFAIFLGIDYIRKTQRTAQLVEAPAGASEKASIGRLRPQYVAGFALPEHFRYHPGHTWAMQETPSLVRVGWDDFATKIAGKIDSVHLPKRGQWIRQGQKFATILRDGKIAELVSPIEGEVTNVNEALTTNSSLACEDPYGKGWLMAVFSPDASTNFRNLLGGDVARRWMAEAASRLQGKFPAMAGAVAQDGGPAIADVTAELPREKWSEVAAEFFLS